MATRVSDQMGLFTYGQRLAGVGEQSGSPKIILDGLTYMLDAVVSNVESQEKQNEFYVLFVTARRLYNINTDPSVPSETRDMCLESSYKKCLQLKHKLLLEAHKIGWDDPKSVQNTGGGVGL